MSVKLISGKRHLVVKRDGRLEPYNPDKLRKVIHWATNNDSMTEKLLSSLNVKIYDKIPIQKLYDEVIQTAANMISTLYPQWDDVAKKLYILKIYKETWGLKKTGKYPDFKEVIRKGVEHGVYSKEVFRSFTNNELDELGSYIQPDRDFHFNFAGINIFYMKYCLNYSKTRKLELPQHAYMRIAMYSFYKEKDKQLRLQLIKEKYDLLSNQTHTEATPKMINAGTPKSQLSSCVLITVDDDTYSIMDVAEWVALFSKYSGGIGIDVSAMRANGSYVQGNRGVSSGPVPFIKMFESVIQSFNQGGKRKGSAVITFPYWHYNSTDIVMLKDAGGPEHIRARTLQYAVKWYTRFTKDILEDNEVYLIDPKDAPKLYQTWGREFSKEYDEAISKSNVRKRKIKALDLVHTILKVRKETGHIYITFIDNINLQRMGEEAVFSSNLCQEVVLPSRPSEYRDTKLEMYFNEVYGLDTEEQMKQYYPSKIQFYKPGEIALCNLASVDLYWWYHATESDKQKLARNLLRSFDNGINSQYYPVVDGMYSNIRRRPIGIGAFNLAKLFASLKVRFDSDDAKEIIHRLFEDLTYMFLIESVNLSKERGPYYTINGSKWKDGKVPMDVSLLNNHKDRADLNQHLYKDWDYLRHQIQRYGVRFSYHFSIAPTANSVKAINATESTEPVIRLDPREVGVFNVPNIVPGLNKGYQYQIAWEIDPKSLIDLAAIRQKFIDQAQSINLYYTDVDSTHQILDDIIYAQTLGIKTLYYMKMPKRGELEEICESCST